MAIRNARHTRLVMYDEGAGPIGTDPVTPAGYVVPLQAAESMNANRPLVEVPLYRGTRDPFGYVLGDTSVQGSIPIELDSIFIGRILHALLGLTPTPVATAGGYVHPFVHSPTAEPGSVQFQKEILESGEFYRNPGCRLGKLNLAFQSSGAAMYTVDGMGIGLLKETDLAGTKTLDTFTKMSWLDGFVVKDNAVLGTVSKGSFAFDNKPQREAVAFNGGVAADLTTDVLYLSGDLEVLYFDNSFYLEAKNAGSVWLEFFFADGPLNTMSNFLHLTIPAATFEMTQPAVGGKGGVRQNQKFSVPINNTVSIPAMIFSQKETFNITTGTNDALGIKVDGGATVTKTLTGGAARTAAQIATDIGTVAGLNAADTWPTNGAVTVGTRLRLRHATAGSTHSIQIDTSVLHSAHAALGLDNVARTGTDPVPYRLTLFNQKATAYDGT